MVGPTMFHYLMTLFDYQLGYHVIPWQYDGISCVEWQEFGMLDPPITSDDTVFIHNGF